MLNTHFAGIMRSTTALLIVGALVACRDVAPPTGVAESARLLAHTTTAVSAPSLETFYGPERFTRGKGAPETFIRQISTARFEAPFVLHIRSGDASGANRVSSATVQLDGSTLLGPSAFNQQQGEWSFPVTLGASAALSVSLASAPGSYLDIWLEGTPLVTLFCPDGHPGSVPDLQQAIDLVAVNGTVLVCDGLHLVHQVVVNKPLTLRSQNPGGATLGDAEPGGTYLVGNPIIRIDGVTSGLVRITDIGIQVADQGILPSGTFDRVEIDGVRFTGTASAVKVAVKIEGSAVPGARVDVTNSVFSQLSLGVWPVNAVETNVRHSTFDRFGGGAVDYSSANTATTQSFGHTEDNVFTNCGSSGCIRVLSAGAVTVAHNRLEALDQPVSSLQNAGAITVMPTTSVSNASPTIVEDNVLISHRTASLATIPEGWIFQNGISVIDGNATTHVVRRNSITDAHTALLINASVEARDNVISGGVYGFRQIAPRTVVVQRNDFTSLVSSFQVPASGGSYQCNWWGSASGPRTPPGNVATSTYAPWATQPIAGTSVSCDPAAPIMAVRVCSTAIDGGPMTAATFSQAYNLVGAGGTISICSGTYSMSEVRIAKSLTIEGIGPTKPVIDFGGLCCGFRIDGAVGGPVRIRGLQLQHGKYQEILVQGATDSVVVEGSDFYPGTDVGSSWGLYNGVAVGSATAVLVQGNTFNGGDVGVIVGQGSRATILNNSFTNQGNAIHAGDQSSLRIEHNVFSGCSPNMCIGTFDANAPGSTLDIRSNSFQVDFSRPTGNVIQLSEGTYRIDNNVIAGTGGLRAPNDYLTWPIRYAGIAVQGSASLSGNRVSGAWTGLSFGQAGTIASGSDNTISNVGSVMFVYMSTSVTLHRNDFTNYGNAIQYIYQAGTVSLTCNWWGNAAGPQNVGQWATLYTPWATVPIANSQVTCP